MLALLTKIAAGIVGLIIAGATGYVYYHGGFSEGLIQGSPHNWKPGGIHGAPGPLMGATGLPVLAAYGFYRLVSRRLRKT
jgi:hypothetical protein